ncbi:MAG: hypothetical protein K6D97_06945 [Clostridia bacterium]|nr:hypothetical protein [Clostridia bacterium]
MKKMIKKLLLVAVILISIVAINNIKKNKITQRQVNSFDPGVLSTVSERKTEERVSLRKALEDK